MPDPKLKLAMAEIKAVLARHDLAGMVMLASPTHSEFLQELSASWSCITTERDAAGRVIGMRVRAMRADFPSLAAQQQCLEASVGTLLGFQEVLRLFSEQLETVTLLVAQKMSIEHRDQRDDTGENPPVPIQ